MLATPPVKTPRRRSSLADQAKALAVVLREEFGVPFAFYDAETGSVTRAADVDDGALFPSLESDAVLDLIGEQPARVVSRPDGSYLLLLSLYEAGSRVLLGVGTIASLLPSQGDGASGPSAAATQEQVRLEKWLLSFGDRLRLAGQFLGRRRNQGSDERSTALPWQTILTLEQVIRSLRIHKEPAAHDRRILHGAHSLLDCQTLVWVPAEPAQPILVEGETLLSAWDCRQLATLIAHGDEAKTGLVLCNSPAKTSWGERYPQIANVLAIAVSDRRAGGWILALNKQSGEPTAFRQRDAALLTPFVALLDFHVRASSRYADLKELLVGLTRSLTSAIDAKDSYTYGHSERVARIAVELGRQLGLQEDELSDIYLAGLLHDIGKIGVRDEVLLKRGPLTPEEFEHVKQHVHIGYKILSDLRPIRNLLPGVLYHHERYDGKGYPDGLVGENIPLLARILAVADGYDAMSTARPYRNAMPLHRIEEILQQGAGSQWDKRLVEAFLHCRDKIHAIRQRGVGDSLNQALDGALRNDRSSRITPRPTLAPKS
jgi:HD-GYP domain-containing protein (c-di-GMP phosphodiesterase class II)